MQKQMSYKKIIICIGAAIAVIAAAVIVLLLNREETFRSILVYEVEGTASIERESVGSMNAVKDLYLESGDRVSVAQNSSMRMKLDDDKYVMAEADTIFSVEAEGTDENSRTKICLERGAVTSEIQHPLSEGAQYETSTPNSVMAVRGTIYRVELYTDDNGEQNTKLCCFQGKVGATPILPDGTYGEEILVPAGSELIIYSDGTVDGPRDITYAELPSQAVENLRSMLQDGQTMEGITLDELDALSERTAGVSKDAGQSVTEQTAEAGTAANGNLAAGEAEAEEVVSAQAGGSGKNSAQAAGSRKNSAQTGANGKVSTAAAAAEQSGPNQQLPDGIGVLPKAAEQVSGAAAGTGYTQEESSQDEEYEDVSENHGGSDNDKKDRDKSDRDKSDRDKPETPPREVTYTVTFAYEGKVFATQEVKSGETAQAPLLTPESDGDWDFDFGSSIKADTTIQWKKDT